MTEATRVSVDMYACGLCGQRYHTEDAARECYQHGIKLKEYENCVPWRWYKLTSRYDGRTEWHFAGAVRVDDYEGGRRVGATRASCLYRNFRIDDTEYNQYSSTSTWDISLETLSILEGYQQHGLIPTQQILQLDSTPIEVKEQMVRLNLVILEEIETELKNLSRPELIQILLEKELAERMS